MKTKWTKRSASLRSAGAAIALAVAAIAASAPADAQPKAYSSGYRPSRVASTRWSVLQLFLARWLAEAPGAAGEGAEPLAAFALRVVTKRHKRLLRDARRLSALTPAERHALRLDAKRLRYALEGVAPLFKRRRVGAWLDALSEVQDDLGRANDAAVAARLLAELTPPPGFAQFARGWFAAQEHASAAGVERHSRLLESVPELRLRAQAAAARAG